MKYALGALVFCLLGCDHDVEGFGPWKNDPVPGGTTLGAYCDAVGVSACNRARECGMSFDPCLEQFKIECCQGTSTCAREAPADVAAEITAYCVAAFASQSCDVERPTSDPNGCRTGNPAR
jgi:hypothetical protein